MLKDFVTEEDKPVFDRAAESGAMKDKTLFDTAAASVTPVKYTLKVEVVK